MIQIEKFIGESKIKGQPNKRFSFTINDKAVTPNKLADSVKTEIIQPMIDNSLVDIQNQIDSIQMQGLAVSQRFGEDNHIGVSQKALTDMFSLMWKLLFKNSIIKCFTADVDVVYTNEDTTFNLTVDLGVDVDMIAIYDSQHTKIGEMNESGSFYTCSYTVNNPTEGTIDFSAFVTINNITSKLTLSVPVMERNAIAYVGAGTSYEDVMTEENITHNFGKTSYSNAREYTLFTENGDYMWFIFPKKYTVSDIASDNLTVPYIRVEVDDEDTFNYYRSAAKIKEGVNTITVVFN